MFEQKWLPFKLNRRLAGVLLLIGLISACTPPGASFPTELPTSQPTPTLGMTATANPTATESGVIGSAVTATAVDINVATETSAGEDSGDEPTEQPITVPEEPTPLVIAAANLLIRSDVSGEVIGDGTLRVYAPSSVRAPETSRVELELHLDNQYITPTPTGGRGTPVPRSTTVASPGGATPTPYLPIITDQGVPVYQRMGASLLCSEQSFKGCDSGRDPNQAKIISSQTTTWSWIISPEQNRTGFQDLQLDVWLIERNLDGGLEYLDLPGTPYRFKIEVNPKTSTVVPLLVAGVIVVGLLGAGFVLIQRRNRGNTARPLLKNAPLVFISYRRGPSWGQARSIEQSLREQGANVFFDVDDINEGHFADTIEKAIHECDYFVVVLAPGTLDSVWVRREIATALAANKTIVPLLMDGFRLEEATIPSEIRDIASHNAITVLPEFYQEAMNRLAKRFLRLDEQGNSSV